MARDEHVGDSPDRASRRARARTPGARRAPDPRSAAPRAHRAGACPPTGRGLPDAEVPISEQCLAPRAQEVPPRAWQPPGARACLVLRRWRPVLAPGHLTSRATARTAATRTWGTGSVSSRAQSAPAPGAPSASFASASSAAARTPATSSFELRAQRSAQPVVAQGPERPNRGETAGVSLVTECRDRVLHHAACPDPLQRGGDVRYQRQVDIE